MHYREWGDGEPVILIHGWPETSYEWRVGGPLLASGGSWKAIAPDTRGHGLTEAPLSGYTRAELADDIVRFMDALGIERAPVIGHDWGGIIAFKVAVDHGDRVTRLALLDTITTGWPMFVDYYYWFMDPDRPERFFAEHARDFIRTILGQRGAKALPEPPESPFNMPPELLATTSWATEDDVDAYADPYLRREEIDATCRYYRSMSFHRVVPDAASVTGERYEPVTHEEMAAAWNTGEAGGCYLDYGVEDRQKTYDGPVLWMPSAGVLAAAPPDDPAMVNFGRHFPSLRVVPVEAGHFFCEEAPAVVASALLTFLAEG